MNDKMYLVRDGDTKEKNRKEENIMGENFYRAIEEHLDDILFDRIFYER